ncbi:MAG: hypothetical protein BWK78_05590, partial [Thiotrichaceae bacterium IS1]
MKKINSYKEAAEDAMGKTPPCLMSCESGESAFEQVEKLVEIESLNEEVKSEKEKAITRIITKIVSKYPSSVKNPSNLTSVAFVCKKFKEIASFIGEKKLTFVEDVIPSDNYWKDNCASP